MDLEEITLFEKLSQLEAYQDISNSTYIIPSSSVLSPLLNNEIHLFVRISIPQCYACSPLRLFLSIQKSAIAYISVIISQMELKFFSTSYFKQLFQNLRPKLQYSKNRTFVTSHFGTLSQLTADLLERNPLSRQNFQSDAQNLLCIVNAEEVVCSLIFNGRSVLP